MFDYKKYKIVYCTPALYMAGGVERVLTLKANYFAEYFGYDVTIILTEGKGKPLFYPLSDKVKVINLDVNFEYLWTCSFLKKLIVYLRKQCIYKKRLTVELMRIKPDITVSLLRREINFISHICDGSKKIGELHVNRANYRNFEKNDTNFIKNLFASFWMKSLVKHLRRLDKFVVLTEEDRLQWGELSNVVVIPDPLSFPIDKYSPLFSKRVIAVGRYVYQKGFDLLLKAWSMVEKQYSDWELTIYGQGERKPYEKIIDDLKIDRQRCHLYGATNEIKQEFLDSSIFAFCSRFEGFGMVLVEAMSCGLPLVAFDCPCGPREIISNNEDGFLVENGNVEMFASALSKLMSDKSLRSRMSEMGRKNVERFCIGNVGRSWKTLFDGLL